MKPGANKIKGSEWVVSCGGQPTRSICPKQELHTTRLWGRRLYNGKCSDSVWRMKKKISIALIIVAVVLGGVFLYFKGKRYEVVITQGQIDSALAEKFPATKKYLLIFSLTYSNPQVTLLEDEDRVQVGLDATLNIRINDEPTELGGGATVTSGIRYDNETQEFYLDEAEFDRLDVQGIPEQWLKQVTSIASKAAKDFIETKPVYRLGAKDAKTTAAKMLLKGFEVRDQAIYVTLGI